MEEEDPQPDAIVPVISYLEPEPEPSAGTLAFLQENFRPVPFPAKNTLDLPAHEVLLRALDLWEFATLDLSADLCCDLLIPFVASYDPSSHRSFVGGVPLSVGRSELAQALHLPTKTEKDGFFEFTGENSIAVVEEFVSSYVILEDDKSDLPEEAMAAARLVKEGKAGVVDWAELMWVLVEKELLNLPSSGNCRYGPHLQRLIQCQGPELFKEDSPVVEGNTDRGDVKMRSLEEVGGPGLSLELAEEDWADQGKNVRFEHCLQRCSSIDRGVEFEKLCKGEEEGRGDEFSHLERLTSADLLHGMESVRVTYSSHLNSLELGNGEFLSAGVDADKNEEEPGPAGSLFFGNNGKRPISDVNEDDDVGQFHRNNQSKRMRSGGPWGAEVPLDFDSYMEQIQCIIGKAKMLYDEKDEACTNAQMEIHYLTDMLEEKDQITETLEKTRVEEEHNWTQTICKYEKELNLLAELMIGYKKALKQTRKNFAEYRVMCPQGEEPFYRDVGGADGLVLSVRELERLRLEKELEMRRIAEEMINNFGAVWYEELEASADHFPLLQNRLVGLEKEFELLKKRNLPNGNAECECTREDLGGTISTRIDTEEQ